MSVTIYDIASRAGVSIATVSRVFSGSARVSDGTRDSVLAVAKDLGYQPHATARSLARQKSSIVSAVIPMLTNYFFVEILRGLQDRMAQSEYDLLVFSARTMDEVDGQLDRALQRGQAAGVLVFSSPMTEARVERLSSSRQSVVLVDCQHPAFDGVVTDNRQGGAIAAGHLIEEGCQRIALIMANPESVPADDRRSGYLDALKAAGHPIDESLVVTSEETEHHGYTDQSGYAAMKQLLAAGAPPDGVMATSDIQAIGALRAIREAGLGEAIKLVGYDDILISRHVGLTTIRQPMYEMGELAASQLLGRIEDPVRAPETNVLSPRLVVRRTSSLEPKGAAS